MFLNVRILDTRQNIKFVQCKIKHLETDFKHIIEKIVLFWDEPELEVYLQELLEPGRLDGYRTNYSRAIAAITEQRTEAGLPFSVMSEIHDLLCIHRHKHPTLIKDVWEITTKL